ncbi:histidine kinase [Arthrobacter crystallopoietes BAB-32]|uniref:Oxygen sensor histidine kinase NreB n=1 Tax=Arthrobacter crystallopoietes BAB-32 TaxID=1246476 RepID=N1UXF1_9MICC|nr:ATP-binding protein [Arthrobacter crystallopoietes]EMY32439.1 histidine kinase [Arthrobacter crystallopoietes BAB-32]
MTSVDIRPPRHRDDRERPAGGRTEHAARRLRDLYRRGLIRRVDSAAGGSDRSELRRAMRRFVLSTLAALLIIVVPVVVGARAIARDQALDHAIQRTQGTADFAVGPFVTDHLVERHPDDVARMDRLLAPRFDRNDIERIKIWSQDGTILYSDQHSLIGQNFGLPPGAGELLAGSRGFAHFEEQSGSENELEADAGKLVEVYVGTNDAEGEPIIFEVYYTADQVEADERGMMLGLLPPILGALAVLQLIQLVPALRMAQRFQRDNATKRALLQQAIDASDVERQRLARDLHDEVIQDLSGLAYSLESYELQDRPPGHDFLSRTRMLVQDNISNLRGITTELYPPDLAALGLAGALERLGDPVRARQMAWSLRIHGAPDVDEQQAALLYRAAREAVSNAVKHAKASLVSVSLTCTAGCLELAVYDDGEGFTPDAAERPGHFGLQILQDTVQAAGGTLSLRSAPGQGTEVMVQLPA